MKVCEDLRQAVLQAAIQGKLTKQLPEDGDAKDLLAEIRAEKERLIKEGKLKKSKALPEITEEEIPFDIPENWQWVRLGNLVTVLGGKRIPAGRKLTTEDTGHKYIRVSDMKNGSVDIENLLYVPEDIFPSISRYIIKKEDVYITVAGTIGRVGKIPSEIDGANLTENANRLIFSKLNQDWLISFINSFVAQQQIASTTTKVGQPKLAIKRIENLIAPLPPLAEQRRIVAKVDTLLYQIDDLEKTEAALGKLKAEFPADMKASLLQAAIQGKLTEQLAEDGTAAELLAEIKAEKEKLIKEGKLKKSKALPEITEEEIPFDIPENWQWVRLGQLTELITSGSRDWAKFYSDDGDKFLRMGNLSRNSFELRLDNIQHVNVQDAKEGKRTSLNAGDLLFSITGEVGLLGLIPEEFGKSYINQHTAMIRFMKINRNRYIPYVLLSGYAHSLYIGDEHGIKNSFRLDSIGNLLVPLPPLAEQERIVAKLEQLLSLCDGLVEK